MTYAIILAGGTGTRFWPLSRAGYPKQFLNIYSSRSQIEDAVLRVKGLVKKENIYLAANANHLKKIKERSYALGIPKKNFFFEPSGKSTLAPIAALSRIIYNTDPDAVLGVFPSDHYIGDSNKFRKLFKESLSLSKQGYIVTLGIRPDSPETGYGYIKVQSSKCKVQSKKSYYVVEKFVEKPDLERAGKFIQDNAYYWNSGIFVFKAEVFLGEVKKLIPDVDAALKKIKNKNDAVRLWGSLPSISIDYAIAEKTDKIVVLPADCGWRDVGSFEAAYEIMPKDKAGNVFKGDCFDLGSKDSFIWSEGKLTATLCLDNIVVVNTPDALLVSAKERSQDVKKLVERLNKSRFKKLT